jgi:Uma2 family endonuclease
MNAAIEVRRLSVQDYHRMAEAGIFDPGERVELLAGQVMQRVAKGVAHEAAITRIEKALRNQLGDRVLLRLQSPVQLDDYSEPEPDISVVFADPADYETHHPQPPEIFWLIEVADSSFRYDCEVKAPAYAKSGIAEYWVLDVNQRQLHVYRSPTTEGYQSKFVLAAGDQVASVAFPHCSIAVAQLLSSRQG